MSQRESMEFDVLIVGAGPAGLAAAIRMKQLNAALQICVIEKGSRVGAHILSGAVLDTRALDELLPDWQTRCQAPLTPVTHDEVLFLGERQAHAVPKMLTPACLHNTGHVILSLSQLTQWLGQEAEALGVEIYPGFAGAEILFDAAGAVKGVATGDMGRTRSGEPGPAFAPGMELLAKYTLFAEGCRGHLGRQLEARFQLRADCAPATYSIGIKEIWQVTPEQARPGLIQHVTGWPLPADTYGGGFVYHQKENLVAVGYVIGLDYRNPWLSPFEEFQRFKTHPYLRRTFEGGKRLEYGARALTTGGLQALPQTAFPGGALIGDNAGFLNAARIKGTHTAMKSGMLAGEAIVTAVAAGRANDVLAAYPEAVRASWIHDELYLARNFKPLMKKGRTLGSLLWGMDQLVFRGRAPWTLRITTADHTRLLPSNQCAPIAYPKPDGVLTFDRLSSVFLSNTHHEEDQPCHLQLKDPQVPIQINLAQYAAPETRYCPAGVYEIVGEGSEEKLQINAQNCVHCKTCDIKDPTQNIVWVAPQGGDGPEYTQM